MMMTMLLPLSLSFSLRFHGCALLLTTVKKSAPGCSGQPAVLDQLSGQFASPNFGGGALYAADLNCSWLIRTAPDTVSSSLSLIAI